MGDYKKRKMDLYEIYTSLEGLKEDLFDEELIKEIENLADAYKDEYEDLIERGYIY